MPEYLTIKKNIEIEIEVKKSRFITNLIKIENEEQAQQQLATIKKKHSKANHNCSAYILNKNSSIKRMSDDGEPSGTAGVPILNVLEENNLTNVLAVVTRYFGGIKLGKGGLIRAYSNSVSSTLSSGVIVQGVILQELQFILPYNLLDQFKYELDQQVIDISEIQYKENVLINLFLPQKDISSIQEDIINRFNNAIIIKKLSTKLQEVPIKKADN